MELAILCGQKSRESQSPESKKSLTENIDLGRLDHSSDYKTIFNKQGVLLLLVLFLSKPSLQEDVCFV